MSFSRTRLLAVGLAAVVATSSVVLPAQAAPNPEAAARAAAFLVAQVGDGDHLVSEFGNEGITADAVLALAAVADPAHAATVDRLVGYLETQAPAYSAASPEGAAKLALVAVAVGDQPEDFGGVDLVAKVAGGVKADGSFGAYPGPFAQSLGILALARAGEPVPDPMVSWLTAQQDAASGGFGYAPGQPADADNTGMALLALTAVQAEAAKPAAKAAADWAAANRAADGSWAGFSPVNSTAVMGMALHAAGADVSGSVDWLAQQQQADGGLPNAGASDLLATAQGTLLLAGQSYLSLPIEQTPWLTWGLGAAGVLAVALIAAALVIRRRKVAA